MTQRFFLRTIDSHIIRRIEQKKENPIKYAKVSPDYVSGKPSLIFDGETTATVKTYPYNADLTLSPNDEVVVFNGIVICRIERA